jgi:formiminotetrahydrofolate cyclodeaminase
MQLEQLSLDEFTSKIASKDPYPGGGGCSAALAAMGVSLGDMVVELTVGKKTYADVEDEMQAAKLKLLEMRKKFLRLVSQDAEQFEPLSKAYGIPKDDPGRDEELERCLRLAAATPLEIFRLSCEALDMFDFLAKKGSRLAVSDAATGAAFLKAALKGAAINVRANTKLMKDSAYAESLDKQLEEGLEKYGSIADEVFDLIY